VTRPVARETGDFDATRGPYGTYRHACAQSLGRVWEIVQALRRPSPVADLLLSGYVVPYDAVIDGETVPVSAEAAWAEARRAARLPAALLSPRVVEGSRDDLEVEAAAEARVRVAPSRVKWRASAMWEDEEIAGPSG
jgi:hypothetical protein